MKIDEKKIAASSYIITYYNDIIDLNNYYANYLNLLLELKEKFGGNIDKLSEEDRPLIMQAVQNVRFIAHKVYIQYNSILPSLKIKKDMRLIGSYIQLKEHYIIDSKVLETFIIAVNASLVNDIIRNMLESSQEIVTNLFKDVK